MTWQFFTAGASPLLEALRIIFRKKLVFRYSLGDCGYKISGLLSFLVWLGRGVTHTQTSNMDGHIRVKIGISPTDRLLALQGFGIFEQILTRHKKLLTLYYSIFVRVWDVINEEENGIESFSHTLQDYNYLWYIVGRGFCSLRSKLCLKCLCEGSIAYFYASKEKFCSVHSQKNKYHKVDFSFLWRLWYD